MAENKPSETETILMALDQINQTIDVMTSVVSRLRHYVQQQDTCTEKGAEGSTAQLPSERIVH